ncbi:MAG: chorismate mutase [Bacteroidota bacterium]
MSNCLEIQPIENWLSTGNTPLVIAGPCSAESREQLISTAIELAKIPTVAAFRAGIWKPRTRPSKFEGVGAVGLEWLCEVKKITGLKLAVEVANPQHVELCLQHKIDILWIGARTTVNPFSVQEIASALKGCKVAVLVKNPIHPDIKLWLGTLERLNQAGITNLAAVHRGFYSFNKTLYRNEPLWEVPIELKRLCPELPVLCDPSHISGKKDHLADISQKALDLEMCGLMIESHINPAEALTDAKQQIRPDALASMLTKLTVREFSGTSEFQNQLDQLRSEIDEIDRRLIDTLMQRMEIVEKMGYYKRENNITILQLNRWNQMLTQRLALGETTGLKRDFLLKLFQLVHREAIQIQTDIMNEGKKE